MATVRFSKELRSTIQRRAYLLFEARITAAKEAVPDRWAGAVYDGMGCLTWRRTDTHKQWSYQNR